MHKHEKKLHSKDSRKNSVDNQEFCSWDGALTVKLSKTLRQAQKVAAQLTQRQTMHPPTGGWPRLQLMTYEPIFCQPIKETDYKHTFQTQTPNKKNQKTGPWKLKKARMKLRTIPQKQTTSKHNTHTEDVRTILSSPHRGTSEMKWGLESSLPLSSILHTEDTAQIRHVPLYF